jgi:DNA-directed RNA polymerase specialized sigma24 family protein
MTVAGLTEWGEREAIRGPGLIKQEADDRMLDRKDTAGALQALLLRFGRPLALNDLTNILGDLWGIDETTPTPVDTTSGSTPLRELETRQHLRNLWTEIQGLPARQRTALLFNLRDGEGLNAVAIFVMMGTTTFEEVAASVEMTSEELAAIWSTLPIDDLAIAAKLGITRQQVINLRKSARERLSRRMKKKDRWEP